METNNKKDASNTAGILTIHLVFQLQGGHKKQAATKTVATAGASAVAETPAIEVTPATDRSASTDASSRMGTPETAFNKRNISIKQER
jgi:hypothetical protein